MPFLIGKTSRRSFLNRLATTSPFVLSGLVRAAEISGGNPKSPTGKPADLKDLLTPLLTEHNLPALAAAVLKNGVLGALGAVGIRKVGADAQVTVSDKFHIGSDTKAMTATLLAMLVEQGKLQWDKTLAAIFPERSLKMHASYRKVTLEMLLTHRSGAPHDGTNYGPPKAPVTEQRLIYMDSVITNPPRPNPAPTFLIAMQVTLLPARYWSVSLANRGRL